MASINDDAPKVVGAAEKPNKFTGTDFAIWKNKMFFYLTTMNLAKFLNEEAPKTNEGETPENNKEVFQTIDAWSYSDFLCRNYILNCLDEPLYKVYSPIKTAKLLWDSLSKKNKPEDAGYRKFIVDKFQFYRMVDSKTVSEQVNELQLMIYDILAEGHEAHVVESSKQSNKRKGLTFNKEPNNKKKRFTGACFVCGKNGHLAKDCRHRKENNKNEANVTVDLATSENDNMHLSAVVTEAYILSDTRGWWIDTGATRHIYYDKSMFSSYKKLEQEQKLFMGNDAYSVVEGQGQVNLKFTSGKEVTLNDVLHVLVFD
ncbi:hypothetical protein ABFS83_06G140900 [Erythranthe nasuta]